MNKSDAMNAEWLELLEKTSEQYRVYKEINDVVNIVRKPVFPSAATPTPERPLTSGVFITNAE